VQLRILLQESLEGLTTPLAFIHDFDTDLIDVIEAVCRRVSAHADGAVRRRLPDLIPPHGNVGQYGEAVVKTQI
jgi:hypothetical protein